MFSPSAPGDGYYGGYYAGSEFGYDSARRAGAIDAIGLLLRVLEYRWIVGTIVAVGLIVALFTTLLQTPKYQATAKLEVVVPSARVFEDIEVTVESSDIRAFQTAREKLKSRALAQRVAFDLNLMERDDFLFPRKTFSPENLFYRAFGAGGAVQKSDLPQETRMRIATSRIMANLKVDLVPNTSLLTIDYRDQNPTYARDIANQLAQSFIDQRVDQSGKTSSQARQFIQEQVVQVKDKLQESEKALVEYAKAAGITVTGTENSLIGSNLTDINKALSTAIQENLDYERLVKQIDAGQGASLEQVLQSQGLDKLRGMLAEVKGAYQLKLLLYKPDFPEMRQLHSQMNEIQKQLDLGVYAITDSIKLKYEETVSKVEDLRRKLSELESDQAAYQDKSIKYTILKREVDSNRAQYDSLIGKLNEVAVGAELKMQNAAVVDLAVVPSDPYSPKLPINLAIGLVISFAFAGAVIYVLELVNNAFGNPDQVESELGLTILGILPLVEDGELEQQLSNPQSALSESYLSLRTSLQFSGVNGAPATLLITSAEASEGKSTTVIKLAEDFASLGTKVLIIDADMRKPSVHRIFNEDNAVGLSNLLTNTARREDLPRLIRPGKTPNVFFMSAGTVPPNPADLLSSARMSMIVSNLKKRYDMIIIDAPPVIGIADVPILSRLTEATMLIISTNKVTRKSASMALKRLKSAGANIVGVAMTMFSVGKFDYNYNYGHLRYKYYTYADPALKLADAAESVGKQSRYVSNGPFDSVVSGLRRYLGNFVDRLKPVP
ncbi:polysaccharide biosynthesis tyrosine autokinase [Rhizobium sp. CG5]|nr:polysaccharide biosynthesis tyrosine autokinase [Rhizobium sp. CG5]